MKRIPYTQKTLKLLKDQGWECGIVERWIPGANIRRDLFNIIDIIACLDDRLVGVQSTSWGQRGPHLRKIHSEHGAATEMWLKTGAELWLVSWKKVKQGPKRFRYEPHIDLIELSGSAFRRATSPEQ